jgi:hypothetical protein
MLDGWLSDIRTNATNRRAAAIGITVNPIAVQIERNRDIPGWLESSTAYATRAPSNFTREFNWELNFERNECFGRQNPDGVEQTIGSLCVTEA